MSPDDRDANFCVRLARIQLKRAKTEAELSGRSVGEVIRAGLAEYLDRRDADRAPPG